MTTQIQQLRPLISMSNSDLAEEIKSRVSRTAPETYTSVQVNTLDYNFSGMTNPLKSKVISFSVNATQKWYSFFRAVFTGIGIINSRDFEELNSTKLQGQLVQCISNTDAMVIADELERAYAQCSDIDLFISQDLSAIEMRLKSSSTILVTYKASKVIGALAKMFCQKEPQPTT